MTIYGYIGTTPIIEYGCTLCQKFHRKGLDAEFDAHIGCQDKHGVTRRAPIGVAEEFVANILADEERQARAAPGYRGPSY